MNNNPILSGFRSMTQFRLLFFEILFLTLLFLSSCNKQSLETALGGGNNGGGNNGGGNNGGDNTEEPVSIPQLIKQYVAVSVSYYDYVITANLNSSLQDALPGKTIKYGVEYGYLNDYELDTYLDCKLYLPKIGGTYTNSFLLYYYAGSDWPFADLCTFSYDTYVALNEMIQNGHSLDNDEQDLYDEVYWTLHSNENTAMRAFCGRFFVEIDGVKYNYKYIDFDFFPTVSIYVYDKL